MITVGVDLAAAERNTALCVVDWDARSGVELSVGVDDAAIVEAALRSVRCGIDAPFGYPAAFAEFVARHAGGGGSLPAGHTETYRLRATDIEVWRRHGKRPLSVSTDLIGVTALRCARIEGLVAEATGTPPDRTGETLLAEVYPAASLAAWGLVSVGYKRRTAESRALLAQLADAVQVRFPVMCGDDQRRLLAESDHAFDALVAAVTAREVALGRTARVPGALRDVAAEEGWIHVPKPDTLNR